MSKSISILFVFVLLFSAGCRKSKNQINGRVVAHNGSKIDYDVAVVDEPNAKVTTDSDGNFEISNLDEGTYDIEFVADNDDGSFESKKVKLKTGTKDLLVELPNPVVLYEPEIVTTILNDTVVLKWSKSLADDFREYKIYRHTSTGLDETTGTLLHVATFSKDTIFKDVVNHQDKYYYRVFVLNDYGLLGGSNIEGIEGSPYVNNPNLTLGTDNTYYLNEGETQWYDFSVKKGTIYRVTWKDAWFTPYTANSVYLGVYHSNKSDKYVADERLIQMIGGPRTFLANIDETAHIKIFGYDQNTSGTFHVKVDTLDKSAATPINFNTNYNYTVDIATTKLLSFDVTSGLSYRLVFYTSGELNTTLSCYDANNAYVYLNKYNTHIQQYADTIDLVANQSGKWYIDLTSSFWNDQANINFKVIH